MPAASRIGGLAILSVACVGAEEISRTHPALDVSWRKRNKERLTRDGIRGSAMPEDMALRGLAEAFPDLTSAS